MNHRVNSRLLNEQTCSGVDIGMNMESTILTLTELSYSFTPDGAVIPWGEFNVSNRPGVSRIRFDLSTTPDYSLAIGDKVLCVCPGVFDESEVAVDRANLVNLKIVEHSGSQHTHRKPTVCPICGSPLLLNPNSHNQCVNRSCNGQMQFTLMQFLIALGLNPTDPCCLVIDRLLTRGIFDSLAHVFYLKETDFLFTDIPADTVKQFLSYIENLKQNVSPVQVLRGLRVPGWNESDLESIGLLFAVNKWSYAELVSLLDGSFGFRTPATKLAWQKFIAIPANYRLVQDLGYLLSHK